MKIYIIIFICFASSISFAQKIATIELSYIFQNIKEYQLLLDELENFKKDNYDKLKLEEENLIQLKKEIQDQKVILSDQEYNKQITEYKELGDIFTKKVDTINIYLQENIEYNEKILLEEISKIVTNIISDANISLVFNENQYFISSVDLDISNLVIDELNKKKLNLKIIENK